VPKKFLKYLDWGVIAVSGTALVQSKRNEKRGRKEGPAIERSSEIEKKKKIDLEKVD